VCLNNWLTTGPGLLPKTLLFLCDSRTPVGWEFDNTGYPSKLLSSSFSPRHKRPEGTGIRLGASPKLALSMMFLFAHP